MYHIRKDGVPMSCDDEYRRLILKAVNSRDLSLMRTLGMVETLSKEQADKYLIKFKVLQPTATFTVENGCDPYLLHKEIVGHG